MRKLNKVMLLNEFKINKVDKFTRVNVMSFYVSICMIYFFITMITWSSLLRKMLTNKFDMKDLDILDVIL